MKFHRIKVVCIDLGITIPTLHNRINKGLYPPLQVKEVGVYGKGYFEDTLSAVMKIQTSKAGRPKK